MDLVRILMVRHIQSLYLYSLNYGTCVATHKCLGFYDFLSIVLAWLSNVYNIIHIYNQVLSYWHCLSALSRLLFIFFTNNRRCFRTHLLKFEKWSALSASFRWTEYTLNHVSIFLDFAEVVLLLMTCAVTTVSRFRLNQLV